MEVVQRFDGHLPCLVSAYWRINVVVHKNEINKSN